MKSSSFLTVSFLLIVLSGLTNAATLRELIFKGSNGFSGTYVVSFKKLDAASYQSQVKALTTNTSDALSALCNSSQSIAKVELSFTDPDNVSVKQTSCNDGKPTVFQKAWKEGEKTYYQSKADENPTEMKNSGLAITLASGPAAPIVGVLQRAFFGFPELSPKESALAVSKLLPSVMENENVHISTLGAEIFISSPEGIPERLAYLIAPVTPDSFKAQASALGSSNAMSDKLSSALSDSRIKQGYSAILLEREKK